MQLWPLDKPISGVKPFVLRTGESPLVQVAILANGSAVTLDQQGTALFWRLTEPEPKPQVLGNLWNDLFAQAVAANKALTPARSNSAIDRFNAENPDGRQFLEDASVDFPAAPRWTLSSSGQQLALSFSAHCPDGMDFLLGQARCWRIKGPLSPTLIGGKELDSMARVLEQPDALPLAEAAWLAGGRGLCVAGVDGVVRMFETKTGEQLRLSAALRTRQRDVHTLVVGNGLETLMATGGRDGALQLWDVPHLDLGDRDTAPNAEIRGHEYPILTVMCRREGTRLVTLDASGAVRLHELSSPEVAGSLQAINRSGQLAYTVMVAGESQIAAWDLAPGFTWNALLQAFHGIEAWAQGVDGNSLTVSDAKVAQVWDKISDEPSSPLATITTNEPPLTIVRNRSRGWLLTGRQFLLGPVHHFMLHDLHSSTAAPMLLVPDDISFKN